MRLPVLYLLVVTTMVGCSDHGQDRESLCAETSENCEPDAGTQADASPFHVPSKWIALQRTATEGFGTKIARSVYVFDQLLDTRGSDDNLSVRETLCSNDIRDLNEDGSLSPEPAVTFEPGFVGHAGPTSRTGTWKSGTAFTLPKHYVLRGWKLGDGEAIESAALPMAKTDPRVVDGDKDGQPGITIKALGDLITLWVVERDSTELVAETVGEDRIEGYMSFTVEQFYVGPDSGSNNIPKGVPEEDPDHTKHRFQLIRVTPALQAPADLDCSSDAGRTWVMDHIRTIFPNYDTFPK
jgi:hypothetical protein